MSITYGPVKSTKVTAAVTSEADAVPSEENDGLPNLYQEATCTVCYKTLQVSFSNTVSL